MGMLMISGTPGYRQGGALPVELSQFHPHPHRVGGSRGHMDN